MLKRSEFVGELIDAIKSAVDADAVGTTEPELNALANQIVSVLAERNGIDLRETYEAVESYFSEIVTRGGAIDFIPDERSLTDELRGYVRMMAIAVQRQHEDGENEYQINLNETDLAILNALEDNRARSGRELAGQTVTTPETVARRLPRLRLLGYVDSYRQGRSTMNAITATGRTALTKPDGQWEDSRPGKLQGRMNPDVAARPGAAAKAA